MIICAVDEPSTVHRKTRPALTRREMDLESALGTFATILHDIRNPLAAIRIGAESLVGAKLPEPQIRRLAHNLHEASVRIQELLEGYMELGRMQESPLPRSHLRSLIAHAVDRIGAVAEAQFVTVIQDVPADQFVTVDRCRIGSVLSNLLANALEAMPAGGTIHISAALEDASGGGQSSRHGTRNCAGNSRPPVSTVCDGAQTERMGPRPGPVAPGGNGPGRRDVAGVFTARGSLFRVQPAGFAGLKPGACRPGQWRRLQTSLLS